MDNNGKLEVKNENLEGCKYCQDTDPDRLAHMVVIKMKTGHIHVHGPFDDNEVLYEMMSAIEREILKRRNKEIKSVSKRKKTNVRTG